MRSLRSHRIGGPSSLQLDRVDPLSAGKGEVVVAVDACGVNFPDLLIIQDQYQFKPERPFAPGGEVAGTVVEAGEGVGQIKPGMRVLALCGWGGFADQVVVAANRVFPVPDQLDSVTAATTLYTYGTALHALQDRAQLQQGETVLVLGAAGGVGLAAVELATVMGATVIAAASTDEKLGVCREKGAAQTINYAKEDLRERMKEITGKKGVDVVVDPVGGTYAEAALRSMAWEGRYLVIGFAAGDIPKLPFNVPLLKGCSVMGVFWGSFAEKNPGQNLQNLMQLMQWMQAGNIRQKIHGQYTLEEAPKALQDMAGRKVQGKAVVVMRELQPPASKATSAPKPQATEQPESAPRPDGPLQLGSLDEVKAYLGKSIGRTDWMAITQEMINHFADATGDHQWIHVDEERAAHELPEGRCLAHGYMSLSLISKNVYELINLDNVRLSFNYGTNRVRFPQAVYAGDRLRMHATLDKLEPRADGGMLIGLSCTMEVEGKEKPACVAEVMSVVYIS
jgi:NADPH:quinone reductase-like Zn-dependent oxidoreductase/acyl dehydratase